MSKNPARDALFARIAARPDTILHPRESSSDGTKYIKAYVTERGTTFAVDKTNASRLPIWFLDDPRMRAELERAAINFNVYPPERGRNSNLHKLPGFKKGALIRALPQTVGQAMSVVDCLCQSGSPPPASLPAMI